MTFAGSKVQDEIADRLAFGFGPRVGARGLLAVDLPVRVAIPVQIDAVRVVPGIGDETIGVRQWDQHHGCPDFARGDPFLTEGGDQGHGRLFVAVQSADDERDIRGTDRRRQVKIRVGDEIAPLDGNSNAVLVKFIQCIKIAAREG